MANNLDIDADEVARAEAVLEARLPTKVLKLKEAQAWLETIAHAEDIDPPIVLKARLSKDVEGVAVYDNHAIFVRDSVPGFPFLAASIAVFSGVQLVVLGIIGEYLGKIHFRAMNKPTFSISETT